MNQIFDFLRNNFQQILLICLIIFTIIIIMNGHNYKLGPRYYSLIEEKEITAQYEP